MGESTNEHKRLHAFVEGRVQGVNFRYYTTRTARRLGLTGWVANRRDGRVECVAEGPQDALQELVDFLHEGPPAASVQGVDTEWKEATDEFNSFRVRYL